MFNYTFVDLVWLFLWFAIRMIAIKLSGICDVVMKDS